MWLRKSILVLLFITFRFSTCSGQENSASKTQEEVGGPCEGCEALFEYGSKKLTPTDTLPGFQHIEPKLKLTGSVFEKNGKTPADNIILYIYQTDRKGIYASQGNEQKWARRHGNIRGWIKTGKDGKYTFYTFRPAAYPNRSEPEHIHVTVKEPSKKEYYIDGFVFDDDPLLNVEERENLENRGGSGLSRPIMADGIITIHRNIFLGQNIPNYD